MFSGVFSKIFIIMNSRSSVKLIFTSHAKKRMFERNIKIEDIQAAIELPDYTITRSNKIEAYKKMSEKTLKVVYIGKDNFIKIITLIWK